MKTTTKETNLGPIIWENDKVAVTLKETETGIHLYCLPKKDDKIYYPRGFMLGSGSCDFSYKPEDWFLK